MNTADTIATAIENLQDRHPTPINDAQLAILRKAHEQVSWYIKRVGNKDEPFGYVPPERRRRRIMKLWGEQVELAKAILVEQGGEHA